MELKRARLGAEYAILVLIALIFVLPVILLVAQSLGGEAGRISPENYRQVLSKSRNAAAFRNGLALSATASLVAVIAALSAAIALHRRGGAGAEAITATAQILGGLPYCTLVIPLYFVLFQATLLDSRVVIILFLGAANVPAGIWLFRRFLDTIPREVEESALLDGTSIVRYYTRIVFPQIASVMTGIFLTTFINCWGNFIVPFILLSTSKKLPTALAFFQAFSAGDPGQYAYLSAYAVLYYVPVIVLYSVLRLGMMKIFVVHRLRA